MVENIKKDVEEILSKDNSGHDIEHVIRVLNLSLKFAEKEKAKKDVVALIALLHDVDDYKLFGMEDANNLTNAKRIMDNYNIDNDTKEQVLAELKNIGYSKRLQGILPITIEGKIVSDADMCDAIGANSIIRTCAYSISKNKPFFDRNAFPDEKLDAEEYIKKTTASSVCHFFEKLLRLKNLMLTKSGKEEAEYRHKLNVDFLYHLFDEEDAKDWKEYLDKFIKNN